MGFLTSFWSREKWAGCGGRRLLLLPSSSFLLVTGGRLYWARRRQEKVRRMGSVGQGMSTRCSWGHRSTILFEEPPGYPTGRQLGPPGSCHPSLSPWLAIYYSRVNWSRLTRVASSGAHRGKTTFSSVFGNLTNLLSVQPGPLPWSTVQFLSGSLGKTS